MRISILTKDIAPYIYWYLLLIGASIGLDLILHTMNIYVLGRYLGIIGSAFLVMSFVYSLRKRKKIRFGSPKLFLDFHEYLGFLGVVLIIIHCGVHFNALLPWLAAFLLLIVIASGFVGKKLLKQAKSSLKSSEAALRQQGLSDKEIGRKLFLDAITVNIMNRWRSVHFTITGIAIILAIVHSVTILLFRDW